MRGSIVSGLIIVGLVIALIYVLALLFVRGIACDKPYENDATVGEYWIHFEVSSMREECSPYAD